MPTPDQENWDTLKKFGKNIEYGRAKVELIFTKGFLVAWEELESKRGFKAPLRKKVEDDES